MSKLTRRAALASLSVSGLTGCLSRAPLADSDEERTQLGAVIINNYTPTKHTVDFRVNWDGELVHDQSYEIEADDPDDDSVPGAIPEQTWPESPGRFTVSARTAGGAWQTLDPADWDYPECLGVTVKVQQDGVTHFVSEHPAMCSDEMEGGQENNSS